MRYFFISCSIALTYLLATAAWSPVERWWYVTDSPVYLHAAGSIASGRYESVQGNEQLRFARPPAYPAILYATGAHDDEGAPWLALLWNAVCVGMVGWAMSKWVWARHRWLIVIVAAVICLPHVPMIHSDMTGVGFMMLSMGLFLHWPNFKHCWAGAAVMGISIISRQTALAGALGIGVIYLLATPAKARNWGRWGVLVIVPMLAPAMWASYVYSETGMFTVGTHNLWNNLYARTLPGVMSGGNIPEAVARTEALTRSYTTDVPDSLTERQRVEWDRRAFLEGMEGHWLDVPGYALVTVAQVVFSAPGDWQIQWGRAVPKSITRAVYAIMGTLLLIGGVAYGREMGMSWHIIALGLVFAFNIGMCVVVGAAISQRHMLPAVLPRAVFYVYGAEWAWRRIRCAC